MANDYYSILGVNKDASPEEIKKAYRKLAREWHPDVAKDKPNAEQKFKEINEAYQILGDPQKRRKYDQFGSAAFGGGMGGSQGAGFDPFGGFGGRQSSGPFTWSYSSQGEGSPGWPGGSYSTGAGQEDFSGFEDPFDIFEQVFGFRGFGGQRRGKDIRYSMNVEFADAIKGLDKTVEVEGHKLKVKLPSGFANGTQVRFAGKGEKPGNNIPPGDLYIVIQVQQHPEIIRQGMDTHSIKTISMKQAALGDKVPIRVVDPKSKTGFTEKNMKISAGTQPGTQIRLRGLGMPSTRGLGRGDHFVTIKVEIPEKLSRSQREVLEAEF